MLNFNRYSLTIYIFTIINLMSSCVTIKTPEGGEYQVKPLKILQKESYVYQGLTNVKGKTLKFYFNQEIDYVSNIKKELVIISKDKEVKVSKFYLNYRTLTIVLNKDLDENTVYTIHFRNALKIEDKKVETDNISLTFTTGSQLSKIHIRGVVGNIKTGNIEKGLYVTLYNKSSGQNIFNSPPDNLTKSKKDGTFLFRHVEPGKYLVYASNDVHTNDKKADEINIYKCGVVEKNIDKPIKNLNIPVLDLNLNKLEYKSSYPSGPYFLIELNKPIKSYSLSLLARPKNFPNTPTIYSCLTKSKNLIKVYGLLHDLSTDVKHHMLSEDKPISVLLIADDDLKNTIAKEVYLRFNDDTKFETQELHFEPIKNTYITSSGRLTIESNKPIFSFDANQVYILDKDQNRIAIEPGDITFNKRRTRVTIQPSKQQEFEGEIKYYIGHAAIVFVDNDKLNKNIILKYRVINEQNSGIIRGKIGFRTNGFIIQLLDMSYNVVKEIKNKNPYEFKGVVPGSYFLRIMILRSPNAEWYSGNIRKGIGPDPIIFYQEPINVLPGVSIDLKEFN